MRGYDLRKAQGRYKRRKFTGQLKFKPDFKRWGLARAFGNEALQCLRCQDDYATSLELQPFATLPITQLLVRTFARGSYHLANVVLRDANLIGCIAGRRTPIEMHEDFRKPVRQAEEGNVFDLFARST